MLEVRLVKAGDPVRVPVSALKDEAEAFLDYAASSPLAGRDFCGIVGEGDGATKFYRLMEAAGHPGDPEGFFESLLGAVASRSANSREPVRLNGVSFPRAFLVALLERILPGEEFVPVKTVEDLDRLTNLDADEDERRKLQEVIELFPVRISKHTARQMMVSGDVSYQYLPFVEELDPVGHVNTWIGQFHKGLLERMYRNRVIFLLNMTCPVYCRFCFRKHKDSRNEAPPAPEDVREAVEYVAGSPDIKEVVITGGDPFLNRRNMEEAVDGLRDVPHVKTLRLATRSISYYPHLFLGNGEAWLNYLKRKNLELEEKDKRIEVATHFIHPDEVSPQSLEIISELVRSGIQVYVQTPFLNGCNDQGPELVDLFSKLRGAGAEMHYIYIPCSPIHGNSIYWAPLSKGIAAGAYLRAHVSDRAIPRICTATPIGKMDWNTSGWAVGPDGENEHFLWIRSPYTPEYFKAFAPVANELEVVRVNDEGTIDVKYMARIGDDDLYLGSRPPRVVRDKDEDPGLLEEIRAEAIRDQRFGRSVVETGSEGVVRVHKTRVELDPEKGPGSLDYLRGQDAITDVVLASERDMVESLSAVEEIVTGLGGIPGVNAVRLRSIRLNTDPSLYTRPVIRRLGELNRLSVVRPLRVEVETWFFHSSEIGPEHGRVAAALRRRGISVYVNTPVISGVNDSAEELHRMASACRAAGMEFHHVYAAGHPLQAVCNHDRPVDVDDLLDMATKVRRDGSGREIPAYIILTYLGEADFGLSSRLMGRGGDVWARLLPYDLAYFKAMDPAYEWPEGVEEDPEGRPVVKVPGLASASGFMVS